MTTLNPIDLSVKLYDRLESIWESPASRRFLMLILSVTFVATLAGIEMKRAGWLSAAWIPDSPFYAIHLVLSLLLIIEVIGLVFVLTHSVANAVGKQFEILSLILLRHSFNYFSDVMTWENLSELALHVLSDAGAALMVFILLGFYYRLQRHEPITREEQDRRRFVMAKKVLALGMLVLFILLGVLTQWRTIIEDVRMVYFEAFFTTLIFADMFIVLISFRYSSTYWVVFRNTGFAVTTVIIRMALVAPPYFNAMLAVGSALFALVLTWAYNLFAKPALPPPDGNT